MLYGRGCHGVVVLLCSVIGFLSAGAAASQPRLIRPALGADGDVNVASTSTSEMHHSASPSLAEVARSAVSDSIVRRAQKRRGSHGAASGKAATDAVLLAVSGHGSFHHEADPAKNLKAAPHLDGQAVPVAGKNWHADAPVPVQEHHPAAAGNKTLESNIAGGAGVGLLMGVTTDQLIWAYSGIVPVVAIVVMIFELVHKRWASIDLNEPIPDLTRESDAGQGMQVRNWLTGFWPMTRQFFFEGPTAGVAKMLLMVLTFLSLWSLFMDWARNIWQKDFWDAIEAKHNDRFWKAMMLFIMMAVVNVLSSTYQGYITSILTIRWRATLTRNLQEKWLLSRAYCIQHFPETGEGIRPLDNPDQRIQEDVDGFINGGIGIFFGLFMCIGRLALFTPILFMLSPSYAFGVFYCPGWLLYVSLLYSLLGSMFTHFAGRWLIPLNFIKQQVEADFRHSAVQVRDNTESIAMYGSEETEHNRLMSRFDRIQRVVWEQMRFSKQLGFFRNFYFLLNDIVPFCMMAGNYFQGQITLGQMMQILGALGHVSDSLNSFVGAYGDLADLRATTDRLYGFFVAVEKGASFVKDSTMNKQVSTPEDTAALYAQDVCVRFASDESRESPEGTGGDRIMWHKAGLVVKPGERVLLLGPDGCGKSLFLRAIAGAWPATGSVRFGGGDALFVPQRPFVPAGKLREALAYPESSSTYTDEECLGALRAVKIPALDEVSLSEEADWQKRLSGGEMQRLALAHALLKKPSLLVLDETTAAIGEEGTAELYATLGKLLPPSTAVVSVDHDAIREVGNWHNIHYEIDQSTHKWIPRRAAESVPIIRP